MDEDYELSRHRVSDREDQRFGMSSLGLKVLRLGVEGLYNSMASGRD